MSTEKTLAALEAELVKANSVLEDAECEYDTASAHRTRAINTLNAVQKQIDEHMAVLRMAANRSSDWNSGRYKVVEVEDAD